MPRTRSLLRDSPALAAYVARVGAEELNFRRFMVKEWRNHYYSEKVLIEVGRDGTVSASDPSYDPTDEEREAIKGDLADVEFPTSTRARDVDGLRPQLRSNEFYEFRDRDGDDTVIMVQERRDRPEGGKYYLAWTPWSDGEWRMMEPDGPLPFWRPPKANPAARRIMIHEGAKSAARVDAIVRRREDHPWAEFLIEYEHWGMIGGALAPHRSDYDCLRRQNASEVVYVCDNDVEGKAALQRVSRAYGRKLYGIKFDDKFPQHYDMADPVPRALFDDVGAYNGPHPHNLLVPATYATEKRRVAWSKKPVTILSRGFKEEWLHSLVPDAYVHRDFPDQVLSRDVFNDKINPYSDVKDTAALVVAEDGMKAAGVKYLPGEPTGLYVGSNGQTYINTHSPGTVRAVVGDPSPWLDFIANLVPDEPDREVVLRWAATLVARPAEKMEFGLLLISETQGVGKSTLGQVLAVVVGIDNASFPSAESVTDGHFNSWAAHKRLVVINEIYAGQSAKAYNKMKNAITEARIEIKRKFVEEYEIDNYLHVVACSNSLRALKLDDADRRWFVPTVSEDLRPKTFWRAFYRWLEREQGYGIVKRWASDYLRDHEAFCRGDPAPTSTRKQEVIREGWSPGQLLVASVIEYMKEADASLKTATPTEEDAKRVGWVDRHTRPEGANGTWLPPGLAVWDVDLVEYVREKIHEGRQSDRLEKPRTVRKVAQTLGCYVHPDNLVHGRTKHARLIVASPDLKRHVGELSGAELTDWLRRHVRPVGLDAMRDWSF